MNHPFSITKRKKVFWSNIRRGKRDQCWPWISGNPKKYANTLLNGKAMGSHRLAWILKNGEITKGLCVLHKCDNKLCCNPNHLFLGTRGDNNKDRARKGRSARGSLSPRSKLVESQVLEIRKRYRKGHRKWPGVGNGLQLCKEFGISHTNMLDIIHRKSWKHLP